MASADAESLNAQGLNAREIALRLDPSRFISTLFYEYEPDRRLLARKSIRLVKLPPRRKTFAVLREMCAGHQLITYINYSPASYIFVHLPRWARRGVKTVLHVEAPAGQLVDATRQLRFLYRSIAHRCDVSIAITDFIRRDMLMNGLRAGEILPVGVDTQRFFPPKLRQNPVPAVLFAGTVIERKGAHLVLDVAHAVPNARFQILGAARGGFDQVVRQRAEQLKLENVQFIGPQPQQNLVKIMQASDIFLLPSHLEGIPRVTLEAAATGLPCIVFRSYETPSVVDGVTGFQVENLDEMIKKVRLLVSDASLRQRMGAAAARLAPRFEWDRVAAMWEDTYERIAQSCLS